MCKIKDAVTEFKSNGNNGFTTRELVMYTLTRVDSICDRLDKGSIEMAETRTKISSLRRFVKYGLPMIITLFASVVGFIAFKCL